MVTGTERSADLTATVIIGQHVRDRDAAAFEAWQTRMNEAAGEFPGFLGAEVTPTRGNQQPPALVTVVVSHRVDEDDIEAFLEWQERVTAAEREFPGFRGSEIFRPVDGVQDEWTALYRFESAAGLDAWLTSEKRRQLLEEGKRFADFQLRTVDNSFGNWFGFDQDGAAPSNMKSSLAVWVGLYPTVVLLTLGLSALLPGLPLWQSMLIGNLASSLTMSYLTMPRYVNPLLRWWLRPAAGARRPRTDLLGLGLVIAVNLAWAAVFYLLTVRIWTLS